MGSCRRRGRNGCTRDEGLELGDREMNMYGVYDYPFGHACLLLARAAGLGSLETGAGCLVLGAWCLVPR